jgi:hypothetical protein
VGGSTWGGMIPPLSLARSEAPWPPDVRPALRSNRRSPGGSAEWVRVPSQAGPTDSVQGGGIIPPPGRRPRLARPDPPGNPRDYVASITGQIRTGAPRGKSGRGASGGGMPPARRRHQRAKGRPKRRLRPHHTALRTAAATFLRGRTCATQATRQQQQSRPPAPGVGSSHPLPALAAKKAPWDFTPLRAPSSRRASGSQCRPTCVDDEPARIHASSTHQCANAPGGWDHPTPILIRMPSTTRQLLAGSSAAHNRPGRARVGVLRQSLDLGSAFTDGPVSPSRGQVSTSLCPQLATGGMIPLRRGAREGGAIHTARHRCGGIAAPNQQLGLPDTAEPRGPELRDNSYRHFIQRMRNASTRDPRSECMRRERTGGGIIPLPIWTARLRRAAPRGAVPRFTEPGPRVQRRSTQLQLRPPEARGAPTQQHFWARRASPATSPEATNERGVGPSHPPSPPCPRDQPDPGLVSARFH